MTNYDDKLPTNFIINQAVIHFDQVILHGSVSVICTEQLKEFCEILKFEKQKIIEFDITKSILPQAIINEHLTKIIHILYNYDHLLQLTSRFAFQFVSLSLDITEPFTELYETKSSLYEEFRQLRITFDNIDISDSAIEKDLRYVSGMYNNSSMNNEKETQRQIERISTNLYQIIFKDKNFIEPKDIPVKVDPLKYARSWELDPNDISETRQLFYEDTNLSIVKTKLKSSGTEIALVKPRKTVLEQNAKRELMLLSSLSHQNIATFCGGYIENNLLHIAYQYCKDGVLHSVLRMSKSPTPTTLTVISYVIARAMSYLHEHHIVHGNLSSSSIFLLNRESSDGKYLIEPKLWNFGFDTGSYDERRLPPEYYREGKYTKESDVYQFGLLLWEMGRKQTPFGQIKKRELKNELVNNNIRPPLDDTFNEGMKILIESCWDNDPKKRPTFNDIVRRYEFGEIYFSQSTLNKINKYFDAWRLRRWNPKITNDPDITSIMELCKDSSKEPEFVLLMNKIINSGKINPILDDLVNIGLIELMTKLLISSSKISELIDIFLFVFDQDKEKKDHRVSYFLNAELGTPSITAFIDSQENKEYAYILIDSIQDYITKEAASKILPHVIADGRFEYAKILVNKADLLSCDILSKNMNKISEALSDKNKKNYAAYLIEFYLSHTDDTSCLRYLTVKDTIKGGNVPLLRTLMKYQDFLATFTNDDAIELCKTMVSDKANSGQKDCSLLLALGLGPEFYQVVSQFKSFINAVISYQNQELASRFIARLTRFPNACEYLATKHELFEKNFTNPWYLTALSRIAGFFPRLILEFPKLKKKIIKNIKNGEQIEATLRLLGVLSKSRKFWVDDKDDSEGEIKNENLVKILFDLLSSHITTPLENMILLAIITNIAEYVSLSDYFLQILAIAESEGPLSGFAMRALASTELPLKNIRQVRRIIILVKKMLADGDQYAKSSCAKIIEIMLTINKDFRGVFLTQGFDKSLLEAATNESDPYVFISLMMAIYKLEIVVTAEILSLFDKMLMNTRGEEVAAELITLRSRMS
ncbi:hypothetical protein TRFO_05385 [Tritrichomonas foetus]|uniref:Protein kinase domain-containing protein n=1 Tax=Tritrichomonas foetus TaxID=1144522 RepID=A0A1J4K5P9_9EUKA|nr:hypothetical protein TRFO_05385 [Tritrichomonas foetus]|eukprot:OHT06727.1 hypothetical protein TRFO_05385 [Tritrichomonas foetus]